MTSFTLVCNTTCLESFVSFLKGQICAERNREGDAFEVFFYFHVVDDETDMKSRQPNASEYKARSQDRWWN